MDTLLAASDIRVEFDKLVAVRDISFELSAGQLLGLVGPNGAGKTTLLRVLAGLHVPTRGAAWIMGTPVLNAHDVVRQHVGFAPDTPPAYEELTINQFLLFIAGSYRLDQSESAERIDFWLEQLWLTDKRDTKIKNLSRGMRQRVTLARTFIPRPHVLLLDETLAGLDPAGRVQLRGVLQMLRKQGCAMIVSSHILADLEEVATHIAIIEHGSVLQWSDTAALRHEDAHRRVYELTTVDHDPRHRELIARTAGVSDLDANARVYRFEFDADEEEAAKLLRDLVQTGMPIVAFRPIETTLEDAYLKAGVKQVD